MTTTGQPDTELRAPAATDIERLFASEKPKRPSAFAASSTFGWRALLKIKHIPEQLMDVTLFPIMMLVMFTNLFGGAMEQTLPNDEPYIQYFAPGILVVSIVMITMYTGLAVNTDIEKGIFDRFRTLPIWRPAPMVGYLLGDLFRYLIASVVIIVGSLILGFRPHGGLAGVVAGVAVLLAFCFALSWIWTLFGLVLRSEKAVMGVSMMAIFPLSFLTSAYVNPETMPGWLQAFVSVNPINFAVDSVRELVHGNFPAQDLFWLAVLSVGLIVVFGTLTMRVYNRK